MDSVHTLLDSIKDIHGHLSSLATPDSSATRQQPNCEDEDFFLLETLPPFLADAVAKILPSKAVRRLSFKTQVMTANINKHIRTRDAHTKEVVAISVAIAKILGLNWQLCQAIAWGHDIGHTPFGHAGEGFISQVTGKTFRHEVFSVVIAQEIERKGRGLNLTKQTLLGILQHSRGAGELMVADEMSPEAAVVMFSDKIAYIWSDINDVFNRRASLLQLGDFPQLALLVGEFGHNQRERVNTCIASLCLESAMAGKVSFLLSDFAKKFAQIKQEMYQVYNRCNLFEADKILGRVYDFLGKVEKEVDPALLLALLTDEDVLWLHQQQKLDSTSLIPTSIIEIIPCLRRKNINFTDPKLDW